MKASYITPVVTAFDSNGNLDYAALECIYDHLIDNGIKEILILGSIGEFFAIPVDMKKDLIRFAVRYINNRARVTVGTAGENINETVELTKYAFAQGADAVIVISPYYFSFTDSSIEEYYDMVAKNCPGSLYLYNFPDRTGYDLSPNVTLKLLRKHKNISGYKDTLAGMDHTRELIKLIKPEFPDFRIYSGFDDNFAHNVLSGGDGCIAGLSNVFPGLCSSWVKAFEENDMEKISEIQKTVDILMEIYSVGKPFVPYIKKAMQIVGLPVKEYCTVPMPKVTESEAGRIRNILEKARII